MYQQYASSVKAIKKLSAAGLLVVVSVDKVAEKAEDEDKPDLPGTADTSKKASDTGNKVKANVKVKAKTKAKTKAKATGNKKRKVLKRTIPK